VRVVFAGTPHVALPALHALLASPHDVAAAITRPDSRSGRGRTAGPSPVAAVAASAGIEVLKPGTPKDPAFLARLAELAPDCCPVVAYGALIPAAALDIPVHGWVNLHFSLLPAWRGAAPVQHALLAGDDVTGASTFRLVEELDAGPVFGSYTEAVRRGDTAGDLLGRLAEHGAHLLLATLDGIESGTVQPQPQRNDVATYAPKLSPADARIDWAAPAAAIDRRIRACTPAPGAWTEFRDQRLKLFGVTPPAPDEPPARREPPGTLVVDAAGVHVSTGSSALTVADVQPPGRQRMAALDWARGARIRPGEKLGRGQP
jgi:methionyl-tRNA formyltransferase